MLCHSLLAPDALCLHALPVPDRALDGVCYIADSHTHVNVSACRSTGRTKIDPVLPACVGTAMPKLIAKPAKPAARHHLAAIMSMMLLLLGSGIAGQAVWRRRRPRRDATSGNWHDREIMLHARQQQGHQIVVRQLAADSRISSGAAGEGSESHLRLGRQARLAALLHAELGSQQQRGIEMLPLDAQPAALTHQLGSVRKTAVAGGAARAAPTRAAVTAAAAAPTAAAPQDAANWVPLEAQHLLAPQQASDAEPMPGLGPAAVVPSGGGGGHSLAVALNSRQWRLPTNSLQVSPNQLEVRLTSQTDITCRVSPMPKHEPSSCRHLLLTAAAHVPFAPPADGY